MFTGSDPKTLHTFCLLNERKRVFLGHMRLNCLQVHIFMQLSPPHNSSIGTNVDFASGCWQVCFNVHEEEATEIAGVLFMDILIPTLYMLQFYLLNVSFLLSDYVLNMQKP